MLIHNEFELGDFVSLKTDLEANQRMVTAIQINISGGLVYRLSFGTIETWHFDQEIVKEESKT